MRKYLFLLTIVMVGFTSGDIPRERIVLDWDESVFADRSNSGGFRLVFKNADFWEKNPQIPVYSRVFNLTHRNEELRFALENCRFEAIDPPTDFKYENIESDFRIESRKLQSGASTLVHLQIVPLKMQGEKLLLLKSFELRTYSSRLKSAKNEVMSWKSGSVLKEGNWVKISTTTEGIYKIPYARLKEWGFANPAAVNVFGSGGMALSEDPGMVEYDDLTQNAVWHGKNKGADCLFFYAPGTTAWKLNPEIALFEHRLNDYATKGFFFLSENAQTTKLVEQIPAIAETPTVEITDFDDYAFHELEEVNILPFGSGKNWYGERFGNGTKQNLNFNLINKVHQKPITLRSGAVARSFQPSEMRMSISGQALGSLRFMKVNTSSQTSNFADEKTGNFSTTTNENAVKVTLSYVANQGTGTADDNATAWLDYVEVNYSRKLLYEDAPLFFRHIASVGTQSIAQFAIESNTAGLKVFDVTRWNEVRQMPLEQLGNRFVFKRPAEELRQYVAVADNGTFPEPEWVSEINNQNLHALATPEFLIVTHATFLGSAERLAEFHRQHDGMRVEVVVDTEVYNEFSSGIKSATGIRNFIKMFYDRNEGLKYVLLFGDGSYDNKQLRATTRNFIPTYQSENSVSPVASFVTDDYFVILDAGESVYDGAVDLGIGRIPATTPFEAQLVVDKVIRYHAPEAFGEWRNTLCFIGDDEDGNLHVSDSEKLTNQIAENHTGFVFDKIYLDAYPQIATPAGERYPAATEAINKRVKEGVLVLNYVGHANDRFMADEHVLETSHVNAWSNAGKLPIFVTATCEFSRFDTDEKSIGEYVLFNPNGGGIGLFSTTRLVYAYSNYLLSRSFYSFVFERNDQGERYRLGDIMRLAKVNTLNTINKRNFSLLADPALKLAYPKYKVLTTRFNGKEINAAPDTIGALRRVEVSGIIADINEKIIPSFSGEVSVTVFDKELIKSTLGNAGETPFDFRVQENIIYKGTTRAENGKFTFSFVVPRDISFAPGRGKILYYASNGNEDAHGDFDNFVVGGSGNGAVVDKQGPEIRLYMDSENFISGGKTSKNPSLLAFLSDENGINTVGTGIGHDITAVLDNDYANVLVLNNYYQSDLNDYTSGKIIYPFRNLSPGKHRLKLKAWDVANNSSEAEIEFEVSDEFVIREVSSYPNPATAYTFFTFVHNQAGAVLDVVIEVFDQQGKRVDYIVQQTGSDGTQSNPVRWEINSTKVPVRSGIYIYRVSAKNGDGAIAHHSGKLLISRE